MALASDPVSAYGGIVVLNRPVSPRSASALAEQFVEVLFAPELRRGGARGAAREAVDLRILGDRERRGASRASATTGACSAACSSRTADGDVDDREGMERRDRRTPTRRSGATCSSPGASCKHVASNAIVIASDLQTIGIGAGQMSRVDAVRIALEKAREHGHALAGAALASDAFFPFPTARSWRSTRASAPIVQPGGSKRDAEVVAAVEEAGAAMVFTSRRHFRH